jgi:2-methylcitrate dehydratase PrpD
VGVTNTLAKFIVDARYQDIPLCVREAAKRIILDTVGCAIGAVPTFPGQAVLGIVAAGGSGRATVLGTDHRSAVLTAAYANGRLANILDIDECYMVQGHHAQATLGAALALCEDRGLNGCALITAFAVGFETGIRLGNYFNPQVAVDEIGRAKGWTGLVGPGQGVYAACAASAHLLGLGVEETVHALSLCPQYMVHRDWSRQWGRDLDLATIKYADTGWNAQAGLMAALSASGGVTGMRDVFDEGRFEGVFPAIRFRPEALVENLGTTWSVQNTSIKFWPCCRWIHYALTPFAALIREHHLAPDEVESIELLSFPMIPYPRFASSEDPTNLVAATFSFAHAAAMVALRVPPGPEWFTPEALQGEAARRLRVKVRLLPDPAGDDPRRWGLAEGELRVPSRARVRARGQVFERATDYALGDPWPGAPAFGETDLLAKFGILAGTLGASASSRTGELASGILGLDEVSDLTELFALSRPVGPTIRTRVA